MNYRMLAATALTCGAIGGAALAQQEPPSVTVDLVNVQADLANQLGVETSTVPMSVFAPVDVAAEACGLDEATLNQMNEGSDGGDAASDGSGDATGAGGTTGDAGTTGDGGSALGLDTGGGSAGASCIASTASPLLVEFVQQDMSGATTAP